MKTSEEIVNGLIRYADMEVIPKLGTGGKWVVGTVITMAGTKANDIARGLQTNSIAKTLGAVNDDGLFDIDLVATSLMSTADRYGNLRVNVPMLGSMTFSRDDIEKAKNYIEGRY